MVAPGNVKGPSVQAPPPHGQYRPPIKAAGTATPPFGMPIVGSTGNQTSPNLSSAATHSTEVLHMTRKSPFCPVRVGIVGFGAIVSLATLVLYTKKKPEATAVDVARVASGTSVPGNTHPRN